MEILKSAPVKVFTLSCFWISVIICKDQISSAVVPVAGLQANFYAANGNFDYIIIMMLNP